MARSKFKSVIEQKVLEKIQAKEWKSGLRVHAHKNGQRTILLTKEDIGCQRITDSMVDDLNDNWIDLPRYNQASVVIITGARKSEDWLRVDVIIPALRVPVNER